MPGVSLNRPLGLHLSVARRGVAAVWTAGVFVFTPLRALDAPATSAPTHITDGQDRPMDGHLAEVAEKRSQANALYAKAMLLPDGPLSDQDQALDLFRQIVALDPTFTEAQVKLANLLLQAGKTGEALERLQATAKAHPNSVPVEVEVGYAQKLSGHSEEALRLCSKALAADPTQSVAMRVMLEVAAEQNDLSGGVVHVEDILKAGGANVPASSWLDLARLYLDVARGMAHPPSGDTILLTRLPILEQAAAKNPPDIETLGLLAETYRTLGRKVDALKTHRRAADLEPANVDVLIHCAELEVDLDRKSDAIADYEKAYGLNPGVPGLREVLGGLYLDAKRYDDAARMFEAALADAPGNPGLLIDLGIAYEQSKQPDKAQQCFQQVFSAVSCPPEAYMKLAFFQLEHKEVKQAGETLASAETRFPQSARVRFYEAVQHRYEKNYPAALASLAKVRELAVGAEAEAIDPNYYLEDAMVLNLVGRKDDLEAVLREGIDRFPNDPELMNELAYFWAEDARHLPEALELSRRAAALEPDNGPILDTWGWVYFQMGQAKDALPYLQRAAVMTNNDPVVLQHVGDAQLKLGLKREALATWVRALARDPGNGDLIGRIDAAQAQAKNAHLRSAPNR